MNDNAKKWVAALRSGRYRQGQSSLHQKIQPHIGDEEIDLFCCLGVACDLFNKENPGVLNVELSPFDTRVRYNGTFSFLPEVVQDWLGLRSADAYYDANSLVGHNDTGKSFKQIAAIIEREPKGLFK